MEKDNGWISRFIAEFRKGTVRGAETDQEYEAWLRDEARAAFAMERDPEEEAREALYAIQVLS